MTVVPPASAVHGQPLRVTVLHCLGCDQQVRLAQHKPHYGTLVRAFLDQHAACGAEVTITGSPWTAADE